jgi:hypothetical protein
VNASAPVNWYTSITTTQSIGSGSIFVTPALSTGSYSYYAATTGTCYESARSVQVVTVSALPVVSAPNTSICAGNMVVIVPSGATSYSISGGSFTVSPAVTTQYTLSGNNSSGCTVSASALITVSVNSIPVIAANTGTSAVICQGESLVLTLNGALTYSWNSAIIGNSLTIMPAIDTIYTVTGTAANSCTAALTIFIAVDPCTLVNEISVASVFPAIFPNPSGGQFKISAQESYTLWVIDQTGKLILQKYCVKNSETVDLQAYSNGIYLFNCQFSDHVVNVKCIKSD